MNSRWVITNCAIFLVAIVFPMMSVTASERTSAAPDFFNENYLQSGLIGIRPHVATGLVAQLDIRVRRRGRFEGLGPAPDRGRRDDVRPRGREDRGRVRGREGVNRGECGRYGSTILCPGDPFGIFTEDP